MSRSAVALPRFVVPALFCIVAGFSGCNTAKPAATAPAATATVDETHAYHLAERVESATPAAAVGGGEHAGCGPAGPNAQGEGACGASCGSAGPNGSNAASGQSEGSCGGGCGQEGASEHAACGGNAQQAQAAAQNVQNAQNVQDTVAELTRVDPSQVCMVRNHFMGRPQLAVQAEGSTYYGCCPGCANRLFKDAQARQAIDPVSHNPVDKGVAVVGKTSRGNVLYFENEATFEAFRAGGTLTR